MTDIDDLDDMASALFLYECQRNISRPVGKQVLNNQLFLQELYEPHPTDELAFRQFVRSTSSVLCLSGRLGSGKTTYLWRQVSIDRPCDMIIIDLTQDFEVFDDSVLSTRGKLVSLIADSLRSRLTRNHIYRQLCEALPEASRPVIPLKEDICDYIEILYPRLPIPNGEDDNYIAEAEKALALWAITLLTSQKVANAAVEAGISRRQRIYSAEILDRLEDRATCQAVLNAIAWDDYLELYQVFHVAHPPLVIVFDGIDVISLRSVQNDFSDALFEVARLANKRYSKAIGTREHLATKIALSIRHENIERIKLSGGKADIVFQITMDHDDRKMSIDSGKLRTLGFDIEYAARIVERRLELLLALLPANEHVEHFCEIVREYWFSNENSIVRKSGTLNNIEFCNKSLRILLASIYKSSISALRYRATNGLRRIVTNERTRLGERFSYSSNITKGRIVLSLRNEGPGSHATDRLYMGMREDMNGQPCCIYRSILSRLHCNLGPIKVLRLLEEVNSVFGHDVIRATSALYDLYNAKTHFGDLVDIHQRSHIDSPDDIDFGGEVEITPRGREYIRKVIINLDYFGGITRISRNQILLEMKPEAALEYVEEIEGIVRRLAASHLQFWHSTVRQNILALDIEDPLDYYLSHFAVGDEFYACRVARSHLDSVIAYVIETLRGPNSRILGLPSVPPELHVDKIQEVVSRLNDTDLEGTLAVLNELLLTVPVGSFRTSLERMLGSTVPGYRHIIHVLSMYAANQARDWAAESVSEVIQDIRNGPKT